MSTLAPSRSDVTAGDPPAGKPAPVVVTLAAVEARRLVLSPLVVAATVFTVVVYVAWFDEDIGYVMSEADDQVAGLSAFLGWGALAASNLAVLRVSRHRTEELVDSLPTSPRARTAGHLLAGLGTVALAVGLLGVWLVAERWRRASGWPDPVELATGPLIVAGAVALGVAGARWLPSMVMAPVLVVATFVAESMLGSGDEASPWRWLTFWPAWVGTDDINPFPNQIDWHGLYLLGLVGVAGGVALARHGWSRGTAIVLGTSVALAGGAGYLMTRPLSVADARLQAAALVDPSPVCQSQVGVRYCTDPRHLNLPSTWAIPVRAVLARVPNQVTDRGLVVSARQPLLVSDKDCNTTPLLELQPVAVRQLLTPDDVWPADGKVHPVPRWPWDEECTFTDHGLVLTAQVGAWAVGLPPARSAAPPCRADGQARAVVALWLAGQVNPGAPDALAEMARNSLRSGTGALTTFDDLATWPPWGVAWAETDMAAALALLDQPADAVGRVVLDHWDRLVDSATPSSEVAYLMGQGPAPTMPVDRLPPRPARDPSRPSHECHDRPMTDPAVPMNVTTGP